MTATISLLLSCLWALPAAEDSSAKQQRESFREIDRAARDGDIPRFLGASEKLLGDGSVKSLQKVLEAYGVFLESHDKKLEADARYELHLGLAKRLGKLEDEKLCAELRSALQKAKLWPARLVIIDAAYFNERLGIEKTCLTALADKDPRVIRRALDFLRNARSLPVLDAVLERYLELEQKLAGQRQPAPEWSRALLAFGDALHRMLKLRLSAAADYRSYIELRRNRPDLFDPPEAKDNSGASRLSLFGADITGKNLAFVLDISGSMMATDPIPVEEIAKGKTVVGDPNKDPEVIRARRRMTRAVNELVKVVQNLPEDLRFNIIPYSNEVSLWKPRLEPATAAAKKDAVAFIQALKAEGLTLTDEALETAFGDLTVDTIYLITDGAPTHIGTAGVDRPSDSDEIIAAIHARVARLNFLRGVRIFTLGFPEADEEFLRKLAAEHSGAYTPIR